MIPAPPPAEFAVVIQCPDCKRVGHATASAVDADPAQPEALRVQIRHWWLPCWCALAYPSEVRVGYEVAIARQVQAGLDAFSTPVPASAP